MNAVAAGILGRRSSSLTASAKATIYTGLINAFEANAGEEGGAWGDDYEFTGSGYDCSLLPVAFDVNHWNRFFETGLSPDGINYTDQTGAAQIQIYPSPHQTPGNFGLLCIGDPTNSAGSYSNWILNGPSNGDLQYLIDNDSFPVSQSTPKDWKGSPGLKSVLGRDFSAIIGQPRLLPLFEPASRTPYQAASGVGSNATYRIVGFVGVTVTVSSGMGASLNISVKPCDVIDPSAVFDPSTLYPLGAQPANQLKSFTCAAPKLTK